MATLTRMTEVEADVRRLIRDAYRLEEKAVILLNLAHEIAKDHHLPWHDIYLEEKRRAKK